MFVLTRVRNLSFVKTVTEDLQIKRAIIDTYGTDVRSRGKVGSLDSSRLKKLGMYFYVTFQFKYFNL